MQGSPRQIIGYLKDCYEADNRQTTITNLFDARVEHLSFLYTATEFLLGNIPRIPVPEKQAKAAANTALLQQTEKTLVFCSMIVTGEVRSGFGRAQKICAPLLFFPATVRSDGPFTYLEVELSQQRINHRLIPFLCGGHEDDDEAEHAKDTLLAHLPHIPFAVSEIESMVCALHEVWPQLNLEHLRKFPEAADEDTIRKAMGSKQVSLHNASAMALIPNSPDTRGTLFELGQLPTMETLSTPLQELFSDTPQQSPPPDFGPVLVPASLSAAQEKVLRAASTHPITLLVGPPGTGKTFTLAAIAVDQMLHDQSVLIACRSEQAVNVVVDKLTALLGNADFIFRGGRGGHTRALIKQIRDLQAGRGLAGLDDSKKDAKACADAALQLERVAERIEALIQMEIDVGTLRDEKADSLMKRMLRGLRLTFLHARLARDPLSAAMLDYQDQLAAHHADLAEHIEQWMLHKKASILSGHRRELTTLLAALRSRINAQQEALFDKLNFEVLLSAFPVWVGTLNDLSNFVPFQRELFDLVIVDEATQCDMASCLPAFYRAKRCVITGDPKQLRHVSFLSKDRMAQLAQRHDLEEQTMEAFHFRDRSILDLFIDRIRSQDQVAFLDEHFRSQPGIIRFSNEEFYDGQLRIMTDRPGLESAPLVMHSVCGSRNSAGENEAEAGAILDKLRELIERDTGSDTPLSIGILSPFRDQVDFLSRRVGKEFSGPELERHRLIVGTAHLFQGEERDVMLISLVLDAESHSASYRFLNQPDLFNVSITRARRWQHVFHSTQVKTVADGLLKRYLQASTRSADAGLANEFGPDAFQTQVTTVLKAHGWDVMNSVQVAGLHIDLLASRGEQTLAIGLLGNPGRPSRPLTIERVRILNRLGMVPVHLGWTEWTKSPGNFLRIVALTSV